GHRLAPLCRLVPALAGVPRQDVRGQGRPAPQDHAREPGSLLRARSRRADHRDALGLMAKHPFHDVAVVGVHNTKQARVLEGHDSRTITMEAALGAVADAGLSPRDIDGVVGVNGSDFIYQARIGPVWRSMSQLGIPSVLEAAAAIATGMASTVPVSAGADGVHTERQAPPPW